MRDGQSNQLNLKLCPSPVPTFLFCSGDNWQYMYIISSCFQTGQILLFSERNFLDFIGSYRKRRKDDCYN
jgi:hypothetical protein